MTGTDLCVNKCKQSRSYLNHLVDKQGYSFCTRSLYEFCLILRMKRQIYVCNTKRRSSKIVKTCAECEIEIEILCVS